MPRERVDRPGESQEANGRKKGKDCHNQDKQAQGASFGFVFGTWNWYDFWRRSWGLPWMHHSGVGSMAWNIKPEVQQRKTSPYRETCEGTNKTLSGNQCSPQPGAPRSLRVSRTGNETHVWNIPEDQQWHSHVVKRNGETERWDGICRPSLFPDDETCSALHWPLALSAMKSQCAPVQQSLPSWLVDSCS